MKHKFLEMKARPANYADLPTWEQAYWDIPKMRDGYLNNEELRANQARIALQAIDRDLDALLENKEGSEYD